MLAFLLPVFDSETMLVFLLPALDSASSLTLFKTTAAILSAIPCEPEPDDRIEALLIESNFCFLLFMSLPMIEHIELMPRVPRGFSKGTISTAVSGVLGLSSMEMDTSPSLSHQM